MNSNSSITFGSSVADSFGDFLPDKSEDEDEYDAFNDETFGNEGQMEDWEEQHEKLASIASDSGVDKRKEERSSNSNSSSSHRETRNHDQGLTSLSSTPFRDSLLKNATATSLDTSFLENFSTLGLRENLHNQSIFHDPAIVNLQKQSVAGASNISLKTANHLPFGPLTQPDIWRSTSAEKPKVAQVDGSEPSSSHSTDLSKMKTLEEIEQDFFNNAIKRPIRAEDLEATLLAADNRRHDGVNQVKPPYSDSVRNAFERNGGEGDGIGWNPLTGGANMAHMIPNGAAIPTGLLSRESPWKPTEEELLKAAPKSCAELEKDLLSNASPVESKGDAPEKARNHVGPRPMSRTPDHLHQQQQQHQHQQRFHPWAPLLPSLVGLPEPNPLIPLARGFFAARNFPQPSYLPRSPIPMSPFPIRHPYANNMRYPNMLNPLQRMPQRNMMPFGGDMVRPRFVPHPLLHPPFHPHMLQQHHLQQQQQQSLKMLYQRNQMANMQNRTRPPSRNGYTGLMTQKEKDWLIKIQLTQLEFGDPYVEDYYYVRMTSKRLSMKNKANPKDNKQNGDTALILPERGKLPNSSGPSYVPRQFEGSLGKISVSNINCPRKLLDYDKREASGDSDGGRPSTPAGRLELKKFRQLLLEVEKLYLVLLSIDDEDKRILALPEDARVPHIEKRKELCDLLFAGITDETSGHINQKIASIRKGCSLIFRSLLLLSDVKQKSLLVGELLNVDNFPLVVTQKDQTVYGFNYGEILIDCIKTIKDCDFSNLLHIAKSLNDAAMVAKYECGKEIIQTLIEQSTLFKKNEEEQTKWSSLVASLMTEVEDIAQLRALCAEQLSQSKA